MSGAAPVLGRGVLAGVLANFAAGTLFAWSLVAGDAAAGVETSGTTAAGVFASAVVVFALVVLAQGHAPAWLGPRRLLLLAAVAGGGGLLLAAAARGPVTLWIGIALLFGGANGLAYGVALGLAARTRGRRGAATGLVVAAYAAGPVLLGLLAPVVLPGTDWRTSLAWLGVAVGGLLAGAALLAPAAGGPGRAGVERPVRPPARTVLLLWIVFAGGTAPALLLFAHAVPVAGRAGLGNALAGLAVSALAAGNLAGRLGAGWWSDRVGRTTALLVALGVVPTSMVLLTLPFGPTLVLFGFLGSGLAYGALSALVPAATADRVGEAAFGRAYGVVFTAWGCAGLVAPLAGEAVVGLQERHAGLLMLAVAPAVPAGIALVLLAGVERAAPGGARPRT